MIPGGRCRGLPRHGAQLRFDDIEGYRPVALATNTRVGQLADLETHRRLQKRGYDRIRCAKAFSRASLRR